LPRSLRVGRHPQSVRLSIAVPCALHFSSLAMFDLHTPFALFDDNLALEGDLLLNGLQQTIICTSADEVDDCFAEIERARRDGFWIALAARYELGHALEPHFASLDRQSDSPLLTAWVFRQSEQLAPGATVDALSETLR